MTIIKKIEMYRDKKVFVDNISKAFEASAGSSVVKIDYEVYEKDFCGETLFQEFLVVTFRGGAKSVRNANGNSNTANFRELGKLIDGGYYDEVPFYDELEERGFLRVAL